MLSPKQAVFPVRLLFNVTVVVGDTLIVCVRESWKQSSPLYVLTFICSPAALILLKVIEEDVETPSELNTNNPLTFLKNS